MKREVKITRPPFQKMNLITIILASKTFKESEIYRNGEIEFSKSSSITLMYMF